MLSLFNRFLNHRSYPLNQIVISRANLLENLNYFASYNPKIKIAPVLKSNAYGHGLKEVGTILKIQKTPFLGVDSLYEAHLLSKVGVKLPILIMGYIDPRSLKRKKMPFLYAVWDLNLAQAINQYQKGAEIHVFVDTGMHREGVALKDLRSFIRKIRKLTNLKITGVMSHLAIPNISSNEITLRQLENFRASILISEEEGLNLKWRHLGGGESLLYIKNLPCNLVRVGKGLYGIGHDPSLKPVLSLTTKIAQIKNISKGESVGYDATFTAKSDMSIGVLPIGYFDGVDRRLSNKGWVTINGVKCQIIGRVSMNLTTIDLSSINNLSVGQEVVVFSNNPTDSNSISNSAQICKTIPYDLLVHLPASMRRAVL